MVAPTLSNVRSLSVPFSQQAKEPTEVVSSLCDFYNQGSGIMGLPSPGGRTFSNACFELDIGKRSFADDTSLDLMNANLCSPSHAALDCTYLTGQSSRKIQTTERTADAFWGQRPTYLLSATPIVEEMGFQDTVGGHKSVAVQNQNCPLPLRLWDPPSPSTRNIIELPVDPPSPSTRNLMELPVVVMSSTSGQPMELSSFQNSPSGEQISSRQRPWLIAQETPKTADPLKGVDLNASLEENESRSKERDTPVAVVLPAGYETFSTSSVYRGSSIFDSGRTRLGYDASSRMIAGSSSDFLTLGLPPSSEMHLGTGIAGSSSDFLTLGLPTFSEMHSENGSHSSHRSCISDVDKAEDSCRKLDSGSGRQSGNSCSDQGMNTAGRPLSVFPGLNELSLRTESDAQGNQFGPMIEHALPSFVFQSKTEDGLIEQPTVYSAEEDSIDLELRLSLQRN